jgi:pimeloyl-ACP methyl ester carboxylesterase
VNTNAVSVKQEPTAFAQRSAQKVFFNHKDMDFYLSWVLGREVYGGSDRDECMRVAAQIKDGDAASWQGAWGPLADQTEAVAQAALQRGEREAARALFLRACTYQRAPLFIMGPAHPDFREHVGKMQACFRRAAALFSPPIEAIQFPFQDKTLSGYFWKADEGGAKRPTLMVVGGLETWAEDCYFMVGQAPILRGYNVITADLSGQGMTPDQGLGFSGQMELPMRSFLDYALTRREVDADRLALFGFSWGGHIVFKAAAHDSRIRALIANPAMPNVMRAAWAQQSSASRTDPVSRTAFDQIVWRFGLSLKPTPGNIARRFGKIYDYLAHGRADARKIECPALLLAGEGEPKITLDIARETLAQLPNPNKHLRIFTAAEGGEAHCQVNNLPLPNGAMLDWLDERFR